MYVAYINNCLIDGKYTEIYAYPYEIDFAHTLVGTTLCGVPSFVGGVRRVDAELFYIQWVDGKCQETIIEKGLLICSKADIYLNLNLLFL